MQPSPETKSAQPTNSGRAASRIDFWFVLDLIANRWIWFVVGVVLCSAAAWWAAEKLVRPSFTASAQLIRGGTPGVGEFFKQDVPMSSETFAGLIRAPDLLQRVGEKAVPPLPPEELGKQLKVDADGESDLVNVALAAGNPQQAVELLNLYLTSAVQYLRDRQAAAVKLSADSYLSKQVWQMDQDISDLAKEFRALAMPNQITNKVAQIGSQLNELKQTLSGPPRTSPVVAMETQQLNIALGELTGLMSKYTDLHPAVIQKKAEVQILKSQIAADSTNYVASPVEVATAPAVPVQPAAPVMDPELDIIRAKLRSLEDGRVQLVNRQREAELLVANPPGEARVFAPATIKTVHANHRRMKIGAATLVGGLAGLGACLLLVLLTEFVDGRLKTAEDLSRITQLPVLTSLGNIENMGEEEQSQWAFKTWTMLQGRLSPTAHHGLVCGFTSSSQGEGRSTWIRLLAEAASLTGYRVLTVATRRPNLLGEPEGKQPHDLLAEGLTAKEPSQAVLVPENDVLDTPAQITNRLTDSKARPMVHIPLPGWVWNREQRQKWHSALDHWRKIENIVILVELPPADKPEAVLLGSSLPNLIWLADSGAAQAANTRDQLETLRHARCNLVGAVLNRDFIRTFKKRFPRWITGLTALALLTRVESQAQPTNDLTNATPQTNFSFSIVHPSQRAAWQQHLTLGPGDVLNFGLFGQPDVALTEIAVGPDGRISYLEAQDILASGLTIDELRARLDDELGKYRRAPHTMITPVAFRSKKYYMLGKVMVKGVYILDRPLTVLEAIARAKGFENGLVDRSVVDLTDFSRSFIARNGQRMPLNFEKLFEGGDLSENLPVEPGDYIYIAAANVQEVYVVGEVRLPGPLAFAPDQSVVSAITSRGGFTDRAYRSRVLVVRGSLNHPEYFAVDTAAIVGGKTPDFRLQPKDIVFVSPRPFVRVEELADLATTAFIQGLITAWVGAKVVQPFRQ